MQTVHNFDIFDEARIYRFVMGRIWDPTKALLISCALNPSVGSKDKNDPTNERLQRRAVSMNLGGVVFVNLFPFIAKSPKDMKKAADPFGDRKLADEIILRYARDHYFLCGWGNHGAHMGRDKEVIALLQNDGAKMHALKITKQGQPKHPLYERYDTHPFHWEP